MKSKHKSSYFPTHPHAEMAQKWRRGTSGTQLRKSPAATLPTIFKLPCAQAGQLFCLCTGTEIKVILLRALLCRSVRHKIFPPREAVAECPVLFIERGESPNDICLSFYIRRIKLGCAVDAPFYHPTLCWNRRTLSAQFRFQYINRSNFPF